MLWGFEFLRNKKPPVAGGFSGSRVRPGITRVSLRGALGERAEGLGCELELHATDALGLDIDRKGATAMTLGVAHFVASTGSATGQITGSTHRIFLRLACPNTKVGGLNSYKNQSIMERLSWQERWLANGDKL